MKIFPTLISGGGKGGGSTGALVYQGTWNASTNTPTLASGTGTEGYLYLVSVAGSTNLDGITSWNAGDWAIFNGTAWEKFDGSATYLLASNNLSDVASASTSRTNLGLGTMATQAAGAVTITGGAVDAVTIGANTPVQAQAYRPINAQSGTTYTFALSDNGSLVTGSSSSSTTFTIPANATTAFPTGTEIDVGQVGTGALTITGATGVTLNGSSAGSVTLGSQYAGATLKKTAVNTWIAFGYL